MTATDSVKALVDDLKEGNQAAQEQLLARYGDMLLRFIVAVLKADQLEAEDIAVETLYRAIEKIDSFEFRSGSPNGFRNWLFQIAKNNFRDRRRLEFELEPFDEETLLAPIEVDEFEDPSEKILAVREALAKLPENQRVTLVLHFSGWSLIEIAQHYAVKPVTVRQWKARGIKTLEKLLEDNPVIQGLSYERGKWIGESK